MNPTDTPTHHGLLPPLASPPPLRPAPAQRPSVGFMLSHPAHVVAMGWGSGLAHCAPGTVGTLWAWLAFVVIDRWVSHPAAWAAIVAVAALAGWWACTVTGRHMGQPDSSHMVIDEIVAFWAVLWMVTPATFAWQLLAFGLFRLFDAVKVGPMAWADQRFKVLGWRGGFGVMLDDAAAALCTLLVLSVLTRTLA